MVNNPQIPPVLATGRAARTFSLAAGGTAVRLSGTHLEGATVPIRGRPLTEESSRRPGSEQWNGKDGTKGARGLAARRPPTTKHTYRRWESR